MGREATCICRVGAETASAKAQLESTTLVLRGALRRRYEIAALQDISVVGDELRFTVGGEAVALALGAVESGRWAAKLRTPPPSLAQKLGLGADVKALVLGPLNDAALAAALQGAVAEKPHQAQMLVAVVHSLQALQAMVETHRSLLPGRPVWVVHGKGRDTALGDSLVRQTLRAQGYVDSKTAAVSETLTATRYALR